LHFTKQIFGFVLYSDGLNKVWAALLHAQPSSICIDIFWSKECKTLIRTFFQLQETIVQLPQVCYTSTVLSFWKSIGLLVLALLQSQIRLCILYKSWYLKSQT